MAADKSILNGVLLVNKPGGMTSHDVVQRIRKLTGQRRVGHTGTLDPQATGLLAICLGSATKVARFISEMDKTYQAEIRLGRTSETFDAEGVRKDSPEKPVPAMTITELETILAEYIGIVKQRVPLYSAVRVAGQRLYSLARKGMSPQTPEREIEIKRIEVRDFCPPYLRLEVTCSKGTYIRSLAHDIGLRLSCGGYLSALSRVRIGHLSLDNASSLEQIEQYQGETALANRLLGYDDVLDYGAILIRDESRRYVESGRRLRQSDVLGVEGVFRSGDRIFLKDDSGSVLAVGTAGVASDGIHGAGEINKLFNYLRVLN